MSATDATLRKHALELLHASLAFDFIGASPDESAEDTAIIQAPVTWRGMFEDGEKMQRLFACYETFDELATMVSGVGTLACLFNIRMKLIHT